MSKSKHFNRSIEPVRANIGDVATVMGISPRTVLRRVEEGEIPRPVKVNNKNFWNYQEIKSIAASIFESVAA
ncbi:MAG: hypothetical protein IME94_07965 [Proteobacteria bacterium]|nr:hypothetical protein [Pseudomonadota bacterium]